MKKSILTALLTLAAASFSTSLAAGTKAGETISNTATFEFTDSDGSTSSKDSTPVNITVASVYQPLINPDGTVAAPGQTVNVKPGETATLIYTVTNNGNATDTLNLKVVDGNGNAVTGTAMYLDNNNNGIVDTGDTAITSIPNLDADDFRTVLVTYTLDAGSAGAATTYLNLTAVSAGDTTKTDTNNVGRITTVDIIDFTLDPNRTVTTTPGAAITASHTLTNTGNTAIPATSFVASSTLASSSAVTVTYTVRNNSTGTSVSNADLQTALRGVGDLPAGGTITITASYTPATTALNGDSFSNTLSVYSNLTDTVTLDNVRESTQAVSDTDTVNVNRGVASVSKVGDNCGTDVTCATPVQNATSVKPGDYIRYTVKITNTGAAALAFPTLRDYVPVNTEFYSVTGSTSQANANVLFSDDRTAWNTAAPTTLATTTLDTTTNLANGPYVYLGLDSNKDGTVNAADGIAAGETLTMVLIVKVK